MTPSPPPPGLPAPAENVVFLLHGIRADTFGWVKDLRAQIEGADPDVVVETPSYGYLPAFNFALPFGHDRQRRRFTDWYTQSLSTNPGADFHFVGHSNGTFVFGESLRRVAAMSFTRVYLAGRVLPRDYDWSARPGQVDRLVNACGSRDVPVGLLCSALRGLGRARRLGVAGFAGFTAPPRANLQFVTLPGGHGAGLQQKEGVTTRNRLPDIAAFITDRDGQFPSSDGETDRTWTACGAGLAFGMLSRAMPALAIFTAAALLSWLAFAAVASPVAFAVTVAALIVVATVLRAL